MRKWIMLVSGIVMIVLADGMAILKLTGHMDKPPALLIPALWISFLIFVYCGFTAKKK